MVNFTSPVILLAEFFLSDETFMNAVEHMRLISCQIYFFLYVMSFTK